ncbi:HEAT repeat domain-containing protein [Streptomyces sp. NBC_00638]|uniref:HEAT repeat domain-containing protein n=1 Tax=unclassified Streptomyces TaxID=2593676 RepID=UPI00224D73B6|nr:HEAT repeat domain-containing protein [Streptomyces sp. NBC_00638]MCX5008942.1 HEAT repeat domain-containing protein [Streptomyces sp. NBC_00638]
MDRELITEELTGSWEHTRAARDALVGRGAEVVAEVLDVLCDEGSPVDWSVSSDVLTRIGEPAMLPLADALVAAETAEVRRRAGWALGRLKVADPAAFLPLLGHAHPEVRQDTLFAFQCRGEAALEFTDRLLPALADPEAEVRQRAVRTFGALGAGAVPTLRRIRREPAPGPRLRSGVLEALAHIGGPAVLDGRDREALRRLTRTKLSGQVPNGMHLCGAWYAVPTTDQAAVLDAFDLGDPEPVTLRTGAAAWNHDHHDWRPGGGHRSCARVFVSPVLDGWTLVFGDRSDDAHRIEEAEGPRRDEVMTEVVRERCAGLSRRFGAAHWYGMSCGDGWTAWCIAERGEVVRHYDTYEAEENDEGDGDEGPGHPAEAGFLLPHQDGFPDDAFDGIAVSDSEAFAARYQEVKERLGIPDTCEAVDIAARISVDPGSLGPETTVVGHGVLALSACGREHGHPPGALPF